MRLFAAAFAPFLIAFASPALAQTHDHSAHQQEQQPADPHAGHAQPAPPRAHTPAPAPQTAHETTPVDPHAGHDMSTMQPADPHASHDTSAMGAAILNVATSADNPGRPPETPPPAAAAAGPAHAADLYFDPAVMAAARDQLRAENGAMRANVVIIDQLEARFADDHDGYSWDVQGWHGGDIHRFWWKSEGEGVFDEDLEEAELQLLYGRAVTPYFDVQAGVRQTYTPEADRTDLVVGVQGLAPYWFEIDAAAFLSTEGELRARAEAEYDLRLAQRLILQPRAEVNLSAEDIPELDIGAGVTSVEFGARLRYEFTRQVAPYVGVEWIGATGETRDIVKIADGDADETRFLVGLRGWF